MTVRAYGVLFRFQLAHQPVALSFREPGRAAGRSGRNPKTTRPTNTEGTPPARIASANPPTCQPFKSESSRTAGRPPPARAGMANRKRAVIFARSLDGNNSSDIKYTRKQTRLGHTQEHANR